MSTDDKNRDEHDESVPDRVPAIESTDEEDDEDKDKKEKDATVDHTSEQSMDGSDPPAW
ncbi:MAG: hypothetical protein KY391_04375 [Actinobacteria bacterium]|nr:hypothetical protein [Actinomycetota bacterium]